MATGNNQYTNTPIKDFYLDVANLPTSSQLIANKKTQTIVVAPKFEFRPDLLSYELYGNSNYWWTIVLINRNQLIDPIRDLKAGMLIRVLSKADIAGVI